MAQDIQINAGELHNEALEYYKKTSPLGTRKQNHLAKREFILVINSLKDFVLSKGLNPENVEAQVSKYLQFLDRNQFYYLYNGEDTLNESKFNCTVDLLYRAVSSGNISVKLYDSIVRINDLISYNYDSNEIQKMVNSLNTNECINDDRLYISTFVSVFNSSKEYWNDNNASGLTKTDGTIIADAAGALHGLLLGPVVSIIEGAVVSIAHEHGWWSW